MVFTVITVVIIPNSANAGVNSQAPEPFKGPRARFARSASIIWKTVKQTCNSAARGSEFSALAFPFRYLIPNENVLSSYFLDLLEAYTIILERQRFSNVSETQVHFEMVPRILKNIKELKSTKDAENAIGALSRFISGKD